MDLLGLSNLLLSTMFPLYFRNVPTVWYLFIFFTSASSCLMLIVLPSFPLVHIVKQHTYEKTNNETLLTVPCEIYPILRVFNQLV